MRTKKDNGFIWLYKLNEPEHAFMSRANTKSVWLIMKLQFKRENKKEKIRNMFFESGIM